MDNKLLKLVLCSFAYLSLRIEINVVGHYSSPCLCLKPYFGSLEKGYPVNHNRSFDVGQNMSICFNQWLYAD